MEQCTKNKIKKTIFAILAVMAVLLLSLTVYLNNKNTEKIVATLDGEEISVSDFHDFMQYNISKTYNRFMTNYNAKDGPSFWRTSFEGETPTEYIRERTLESLIRIKASQKLMNAEGILEDETLEDFLFKLRSNQGYSSTSALSSTDEDVQENGVIESYRSLYKKELETLLTQGEGKYWIITDEKLQQEYEARQESQYKKPDKIVANVYRFSSADFPQMEKIIEVADSEQTLLEEASAQEIELSKENQTFDGDFSTRKKAELQIKEEVKLLQEDEISDPLYLSSEDLYAVVAVTSRSSDGYYPFDEIKERLKEELLLEEYEKYIKEKVNSVQFVLNESVYNSVYP